MAQTDVQLTARELEQIDRANTSKLRPVVFVHGLWLLASSWDRWAQLFEQSGYAAVSPGWPDDPETIEEAKADPSVFAHKMVGQVTDYYLDAISRLERQPAVIGHSFGGLIAQKLAGEGAAAATVAIDPAPFQGVVPLPVSSLKSAGPVLGNPLNAGRAVTLTFEQFQYGWTNNLDEAEARDLYETFHVAAPGAPLFQAATANFNPFAETKVDTRNPDRGPLLLINGTDDHTVPLAITHASLKLQQRNAGVTEFAEVAGRGHSLTIDSGWREVAQLALRFIQRHAPSIEAAEVS
jgi:non-heme chloroperoxidase